MPSPHIGAEAIVPVISATGRIQGNSAIPVYVYTSIPSDRRGLGMAAQPVVFITDSDLVENGGQYKLQGRLTALPVIQMPAGSRAIGMPAIPVYDVTNKDWPPAFNPVSGSVPSAPINLVATAISSAEIDLTWTAPGGQTSYKLERKTGIGGTYAQIATPAQGATTYADTGLSTGNTYYYRIRATNAAGDSGYSNEANATPQSVLASAPWVAQWKFNGDGNDSIGRNVLTLNNTPTFPAGKINQALGLAAASSQSASRADNADLELGNIDFTIAAWVRLASKPANYMHIASKVGSGNNEYWLTWSNTADRFQFAIWQTGVGLAVQVQADAFGSPALNTWYLVIARFNSATQQARLSINLTEDTGTAAITPSPGNNTFYIGAQSAAPSRFWDGQIDNVCLAKSTAGAGGYLSDAQCAALYNNGNGTETISGIPGELVATNGNATRATYTWMDRALIAANSKMFAFWLGADWNEYAAVRISGIWGDPVIVGSAHGTDVHNWINAAIDSSGYFYVFYGCHDSPLYYKKSTNPYDISAWGAETSLDSLASYPHPLVDSLDHIHLFYRADNGVNNARYLKYIKSTDHGATWSAAVTLVDGGADNVWAYPGNPAIGSDDSMHLSWGWRTSVGTNNSAEFHDVLYMQSTDGGTTWKKADGTAYTLPVVDATADRIVATPGARPETVALDGSNNPFVLWNIYQGNPLTALMPLQEGHWTGSAWAVVDIPGGSVYNEGQLVVNGSTHYVYASRWVSGVQEIYRVKSTDSGATWIATALTSGSASDQNFPAPKRLVSNAVNEFVWTVNGNVRYLSEAA